MEKEGDSVKCRRNGFEFKIAADNNKKGHNMVGSSVGNAFKHTQGLSVRVTITKGMIAMKLFRL